ncbi:MAG: TVP38/TMEM64 family protein [Ornithinimicrobium sp.]
MTQKVTTRQWIVRAAVMIALLVTVWWAYQKGVLEPEAVRDRVDQAGIWGPVIFIAVYAVLSLLPVPLGLFTVLAGAVFGGIGGVVVVWIGAMLGSLAGFFLARSTIRPVLEPLIETHQGKVWQYLEGTGVFPVLAIRLMPVAPFMAVNYVSGATGIPLVSYTLGTALGILPAVALYVQVGASALDDPARLLWSLAGIVVLIVIGYLLVQRGRSKSARGEDDESPQVGAPVQTHARAQTDAQA